MWVKDRPYSVDVFFFDFQKAFDKVPKTRLLQKLSAYGIEGKVLCWIADFLSDRKMRIMVLRLRGEYSESVNGLMLSAGFHKGLYWDLDPVV